VNKDEIGRLTRMNFINGDLVSDEGYTLDLHSEGEEEPTTIKFTGFGIINVVSLGTRQAPNPAEAQLFKWALERPDAPAYEIIRTDLGYYGAGVPAQTFEIRDAKTKQTWKMKDFLELMQKLRDKDLPK
jgi:hypothetical protein